MPKHRGTVARSTTIDVSGHRWVNARDTRTWWYTASRVYRKRPDARDYLNQYGHEYPWRQLWMAYGQKFISPTLKEVGRTFPDNDFMPEGYCYSNSLHFALDILRHNPQGLGRVKYVEGLAVEPTGAYPHAWISIDGKVIDPTWSSAFLASYFGVAFDPFWMRDLVYDEGWTGGIARWWAFEEPITQHLRKRGTARQKRS